MRRSSRGKFPPRCSLCQASTALAITGPRIQRTKTSCWAAKSWPMPRRRSFASIVRKSWFSRGLESIGRQAPRRAFIQSSPGDSGRCGGLGKDCGMARNVNIAGAQLGGIARNESRQRVVGRLIDLLHDAHERGAEVVVFPELALTTFFPRWGIEDQAEIDSFLEAEMPNAATRQLFDAARELGVGFYLGYAELVLENGKTKHYNAATLVDRAGKIVGKYRKVHLPGHADHSPNMPYQHLEKRYFDVPPDGFGVWDFAGGRVGMAICNDRRWPETYRVMALKGAEVVMLGYNTPTHIPWEPIYDHLSAFHNHLVMQAAGYQNSMYLVGVAKAGKEEGSNLLAGSCIVAPSGEIIAMASTDGDEVFISRCDLDHCLYNRKAMFNFAEHRQVQHYQNLTEKARS